MKFKVANICWGNYRIVIWACNVFVVIPFFKIIPLLSAATLHTTEKNDSIYKSNIENFDQDLIGKGTKHLDRYEINFEEAKTNLAKAKNNLERSIAYFQMGDAKYKMTELYEALLYFQKADIYAKKSNSLHYRFLTNIFLSNTYSKIGVKSQADNSWEIAAAISKKTNDPEYSHILYSLKSSNLSRDNKFCEATRYDSLCYIYNKKEAQNRRGENIWNHYLVSCNMLSYSSLKCGNYESAKIYIREFETVFDNSSDYENHYLLEYYFLCKALIYINEGHPEEAKEMFDKAIERAKKFKNNGTLITIIRERLLHNIGDSYSQQQYFGKYVELYDQLIKESSLAYESELKKQQTHTADNRKSIVLLITLSFLLMALILCVIYYSQKRKKELETSFNRIIQNLEESGKSFNHINSSEKLIYAPIDSPRKQINISKTKENQLLNNLAKFESGTDFTSKNFTISNLASILESNTKYTNHILKKHRDKNFNDYINGLKINFIINQLYENPEYLNYKINYLADLGGFSSHSRFAYIFKKEFNISPSDFIEQLKKKRRTTTKL